MTTCRTIEIRAPLRTLLITAGLLAGGSVAAAAATGDILLAPTPLILKDGRIANVSVHVVAFAPGRSALESAIAQNLRILTEQVATDCFLTAQVIGHVGSGEVAGNDTLNAHRLARARADAVQASLIEGGLPAKAIASVWDWQFMVRDARATLWVFQLTPGEDCEGAPLEGAAPALVARAEPPAAPATSAPRPAPTTSMATPSTPTTSTATPSMPTTSTATPSAPATGDAAPAETRTAAPTSPARVSPPPPAEAVTTRPAMAETPRPEKPAPVAAVPAGPSPSPAQVPSVVQALPAASAAASQAPAGPAATSPVEASTAEAAPAPTRPAENPSKLSAPAERAPAALPQAEVVAALPERSEPAPAALDVQEERLAIVFPSNSSYFPPGTGSQLRALLRTLAADRRYEVVLESSVSGSRKVVGAETEEEAVRYNKWLAERRLERVQDWLAEHAAGSDLLIKPEYRADDESRQVVIRIRPVG